MTKRLVLIAFTAVSLMCAGVVEAKVCRLGDGNCDKNYNELQANACDTNIYKKCDNPRAGAPYCMNSTDSGLSDALYTEENCCSALIEKGYQNCLGIENQENMVGYGKSCLGSNDNIRYWEFCGCAYGFVDAANVENYVVKGEGDGDNRAIPYEMRCHFDDEHSTSICKFARCGGDGEGTRRRWFYKRGGDYCKYRLDTRCGGFGCKQLYDCDNLTEDGKEYYRNESLYLDSREDEKNFLEYSDTDPLSNERRPGYDDTYDNGYGARIAYGEHITGYSEAGGYTSEPYNLANKIVCAYEGVNGDLENPAGLRCNDVPNYCYLFDKEKVCNEARGWYKQTGPMEDNVEALKAAVVYYGPAYQVWLGRVETNADYSHMEFKGSSNGSQILKAINENFEYSPSNNRARQDFFDTMAQKLEVTKSACFRGDGVDGYCKMLSAENGCVYITHDCHPNGNANSRHCYKRIACAEENGFYHSFINASRDSLYRSSLNEPYFESYRKYNGILGADNKPLVDLHSDQMDRYITPACVYEINACNDTENGGVQGGGCYRKISCDHSKGFVSPEEYVAQYGHNLEQDWDEWFRDLRPICNDLTRCYKVTGCEPNVGSYSSSPNTSFFEVINSAASGIICYRAQDCNYPAGAYSTSPNTSFFEVINSLATGLTCYRGQDCHYAAGAYNAEPNTSFFITANSVASGSTCYRGVDCNFPAGAYTASPNTSFFKVISSSASGSIAYRAERAHFEVGAYTSEPNTSFFYTIKSEASGSTAYRAERAHFEAGAYADEPNTSFFVTINSLASGSISYRAERVHFEAGAYTSEPNTSFFYTIKSEASGSTSYRAERAHFEAGAYADEPNTSFFITINSSASGSTCYRGESCNEAAGAYTFQPNTSFFNVIDSSASGSICYRAQGCNLPAGAYSTSPNEYFFYVEKSIASGSTCYRGVKCRDLDRGAYSSQPNTSFFEIIVSHASGSSCYRGIGCHEPAGAYSFVPNTSFFKVIDSSASGSICYRGEECHYAVGAYKATPNTSFFKVINSSASGSTCYRGEDCNYRAGAYNFEPNTVYFKSVKSEASGSTCYRGIECAETANSFENTSYFVFVKSEASGSTCYRSIGCNTEAGAYSFTPNTSFFDVVSITNAKDDSTCYRGKDCHYIAGAYSDEPNTSFFITIDSLASGLTCYRGQECNLPAGAYSFTPNTSFFAVAKSLASGSTCYRGEKCQTAAGAYADEPNTQFFKNISSKASGSTCYRAEDCAIEEGSVRAVDADRLINTSYFKQIKSSASGSVCYRGDDCNDTVGAYEDEPNAEYFVTVKSVSASGKECYRGESCNLDAGAYSTKPNTSFFKFLSSQASGSECYRGDGCNLPVGAYISTPNILFFNVITSESTGSTCYRGESCNTDAGAYSSLPNTLFFNYITSKASGSTCYRADGLCAPGSTDDEDLINTSFFEKSTSKMSGKVCYRGDGCNLPAGAYDNSPNRLFFKIINSLSVSEKTCYRGERCNFEAGAYNFEPNTSFFNIVDSSASGSTCYRGQKCNTAAGAYGTEPNTDFFKTISSEATGITCYRAEDCAEDSIREADADKLINTSFFKQSKESASGSICYRGDDCNYPAGAYENEPNTNYFITIKSVSSTDKTCYRGESCNEEAGAYTSTPNTSFFKYLSSQASGSECFRADGCNLPVGAYSFTPNTSFFNVITSESTGTTCYRGESCNEAAGAYTSTPNTSFFKYLSSLASGSECYRADGCNLPGGAYSFTPNTNFFNVITSDSTGTTCYRGESCNEEAGAYSSKPNTSFFKYLSSLASGSECYRADGCNLPGGAYSFAPNTSFFNIITSDSTGTSCYRGESCNEEAGAYSSEPNTLFFKSTSSLASGSECFRADGCNLPAGSYSTSPNTSFFKVVTSESSGTICYRGLSCAPTAKSQEGNIDTNYFILTKSEVSGITCYRGDGCNEAAGAYSSKPSSWIFKFSSKVGTNGNTCSKVSGCNSVNNCFFTTSNTSFGGKTCSYATGSRYATSSNSSVYTYTETSTTVTLDGSSLNAYYPTGCQSQNYWYSSTSNSYFNHDNCFDRTSLTKAVCNYNGGNSQTCYTYSAAKEFDYCENLSYSDYSTTTGTGCPRYFHNDDMRANGSRGIFKEGEIEITAGTETGTQKLTAYYPSQCNEENYWFTSTTSSFQYHSFTVTSCNGNNITCYKAYKGNCALKEDEKNVFGYTTEETYGYGPNSININDQLEVTNYKVNGCNTENGYDTSVPSQLYFTNTSYSISGACGNKTCYRATGCGRRAYSVSPNTAFFDVTQSTASGTTCYRGTCNASRTYTSNPDPDNTFFDVVSSEASGNTCYRVRKCMSGYCTNQTFSMNSQYFEISEKSVDADHYIRSGDLTCWKQTGCKCGKPSECDTSYFTVGDENKIEADPLCGSEVSGGYCLRDNTEIAGADKCHLTVIDRCTGENSEDQTDPNATTCTNYNTDERFEHARFYTWGNAKTCGTCSNATTRKVPVGCNEKERSHDVSYSEMTLSDSNVDGFATLPEGTTRYKDIFAEHDTREYGTACGDNMRCVISCSCADGWFQTPEAAAASVGSDISFSASAGGKRNITTSSAKVGLMGDTEQISPANAKSGDMLVEVTTLPNGVIKATSTREYAYGDSGASLNGAKTCYHAPTEICPEGYFEQTPPIGFTYNTTSVGNKTCYQLTDCEKGYFASEPGQCKPYRETTWGGSKYYCQQSPTPYDIVFNLTPKGNSGNYGIVAMCPKPNAGQLYWYIHELKFRNNNNELVAELPDDGVRISCTGGFETLKDGNQEIIVSTKAGLRGEVAPSAVVKFGGGNNLSAGSIFTLGSECRELNLPTQDLDGPSIEHTIGLYNRIYKLPGDNQYQVLTEFHHSNSGTMLQADWTGVISDNRPSSGDMSCRLESIHIESTGMGTTQYNSPLTCQGYGMPTFKTSSWKVEGQTVVDGGIVVINGVTYKVTITNENYAISWPDTIYFKGQMNEDGYNLTYTLGKGISPSVDGKILEFANESGVNTFHLREYKVSCGGSIDALNAVQYSHDSNAKTIRSVGTFNSPLNSTGNICGINMTGDFVDNCCSGASTSSGVIRAKVEVNGVIQYQNLKVSITRQ